MPLRIARKIRRLGANQRRHGILKALNWVGQGCFSKLTGLDLFYLFFTEADRLKVTAPIPPGITCRFLTAEEIRRYGADRSNKLDPDSAERVALGHVCYAALEDDVLASYGWYATRQVGARHHWGISLKLPPGSALAYSGFTRSEYRGMQLHGILKREVMRELGSRHIRGFLGIVQARNYASLQSLAKMGGEKIGWMVTFGWRKRCPLAVSQSMRDLGFQFGTEQNLAPVLDTAASLVCAGSKNGPGASPMAKADDSGAFPSLRL